MADIDQPAIPVSGLRGKIFVFSAEKTGTYVSERNLAGNSAEQKGRKVWPCSGKLWPLLENTAFSVEKYDRSCSETEIIKEK